MKYARKEDGEVIEEHALLAVSLKVNAEIVDRLGTSHFSAKIVQITRWFHGQFLALSVIKT
jgi:hypothetical protein